LGQLHQTHTLPSSASSLALCVADHWPDGCLPAACLQVLHDLCT
jgi:hypothetical protein